MIQLTEGYIVRHAPATGAQGREAALIDVAQDILLRHLSDTGVLEPPSRSPRLALNSSTPSGPLRKRTATPLPYDALLAPWAANHAGPA